MEFVKLNFDFHPQSVRAMLAENGFKLEREISVSFLRAAFFKRIMSLKLMLAKENFLQHTLSWAAISPSIFLRSSAVPQGAEPAGTRTEVFFRCPACGHYPLADTPPELKCEQCGQTYTFKDGIYDFRLK